MKKLCFIFLTCLFTQGAHALPLGNPAEPTFFCYGLICGGGPCPCLFDFWCDPCYNFCHSLSLRAGYSGNFVFNRHMELVHGEGVIDHTKLTANSLFLALNFFNQFDLYTNLGAGRLWIETNGMAFGAPEPQPLTIESETHFAWSVGGRATLYEWRCFKIGAMAEYFYMRPDIERLTSSDSFSVYPDRSLKFREGQAGFAFSYKIHCFVPYIGAKWSWAKLIMSNSPLIVNPNFSPISLQDLQSDTHAGFACGVSLVGCQMAAVTIEGRWGDERGLFVNGQFRF